MTKTSNNMPYTTLDAVEIARKLEPEASKWGLHIAIGGSCVYRGWSEKDIDVFIYPHNRQVVIDRQQIAIWLSTLGYDFREPDKCSTKIADVYVTTCRTTGRRVDFFFLERHTLLNFTEEKVTPLQLTK